MLHVDQFFLSHFNEAKLLGLRTQAGGGGDHDEGVLVRKGGRGFKPGEHVCILTIYFPFLKIFLIKKKNENNQDNGGFSDVTSEQLSLDNKIAPGIK